MSLRRKLESVSAATPRRKRLENMRPADAALFAPVLDALAGDAQTVRCFRVPGRIEVLGKHTDYAGGRSLLCAVERGIALAMRPRADTTLRIRDVPRGETVEGDISPLLDAPAGHWSAYPFTVARRMAENFPRAHRGADICFASDLPVAAGMSSSSALVVATFLALSAANDLPAEPEYARNLRTAEDLAGYLGSVENGHGFRDLPGERGVGTFGGSEDHTAILCSRPGMLVQYSFAPVRFERVLPVPDGMLFAIAACGIAAEKTGAALEQYNALSLKAAALAEVWYRAAGRASVDVSPSAAKDPARSVGTPGGGASVHPLPNLAAALAASADALELLRSELRRGVSAGGFSARALSDRLEQFLVESAEIIPAAGDALAAGDVARFGQLVDRSQDGAERLLGNQVPETIFLQRAAREHGATAASAFGAGFGGSVWALVGEGDAGGFAARWERAYRGRFPNATRAAFFLTRAAPPAAEV